MAKTVMTDLPHNSYAEKVVLGSAMVDSSALFNVVSSLEENDFYEGKHQLIYRACRNIMERHQPVDALTVTSELLNFKELDNIGGVKYIQECTDSTVALSSIDYYVGVVSDQSVLRKMLLTIKDIESTFRNEEIENVNDFIADSEMKFKTAIEKRRISNFSKISDIANEVQLQIEAERVDGEDGITGLTTGFTKLNELTQGLRPGELTILAARPSVGKTALALNIAYKAAIRSNKPVAIFSCEMNSDTLVSRLVASEASVPLDIINRGNLHGGARAKVVDAVKRVSNAPIFIDDTSNPKLMDIIAKSRKLQASYPDLALIVIDYLGLISASSNSKNPDSRQEEVRKISLSLKGLARDLKVPVLVLSQLSRDVEKRDTKKPMLSDLRDSGSIEQDADIVLLMYREDYYQNSKKDTIAEMAGNKKPKNLTGAEKFELAKANREKQIQESLPGDASYVEVIVAKNRNGKIGVAPLFFYKSYGRFESPSQDWIDEMNRIKEGSLE